MKQGDATAVLYFLNKIVTIHKMIKATAVALLSVIVICHGADLPEFLQVCSKNDPNLIECLIKSAEGLKPILATGAPEYNIPSLEPLYMDELIRDKQGNLQVTAKNVKAYGSSNFFVKDIKINHETEMYDIDVELPNLLIEAEYGIDGKVLLLPIKGSGPMSANVTDVLAKVTLQGEIIEKDGAKYLHFKTMVIKVKVGAGTGRLENLFNGDKVLGDIINDTINKNMETFLKELMPMIEKNLAKVFLEIANNIVSSYTYEQLFPSN